MKKVTIVKRGNHYEVRIGGVGYSLANTKAEAERKASQYRRQLKQSKTQRFVD